MREKTCALLMLAVVTTGILMLMTPAAVAQSDSPSLVSFSSGALVVQKPQEYGASWGAFWILDERADTGWATPKGVTGNQVIVIEMAQRSLLKSLEFDNAHADGPKRGAKDIDVEVSDTSAKDGFQRIASVSLADQKDNQKFPVSAEVPGRWVRLTVKNNQGASDYVELFDFRARGQVLGHDPFPEISGTYESTYGDMHIRKEGNSMVGCYEHADGRLEGGIEDRVMKVTWRENNQAGEGPAIMVFSRDGQQFIGLWWHKGENSGGAAWNGKKKSNVVGTCPNWKGDVQGQMAGDLDQFGKATVYGIVFDTDSDRIKDESRPTLEKILALLKARPELKLSIEGHTDSTGTAEHNQDLSVRRAKSVVAYLTNAGIEAGRLSSAGFGATHPVATNDTALGRAQNRRVELVKK